jgi:hypothetical protein
MDYFLSVLPLFGHVVSDLMGQDVFRLFLLFGVLSVVLSLFFLGIKTTKK